MEQKTLARLHDEGLTIKELAGGVKLAALKKASQGSTKLSGFTPKMTKTKLNF